jgi:hypothetical protein
MVARVEFSMVGRVIRYQSSGIRKRANSEQRSATRRQEKAYAEGTESTEFAEKRRKSRSLHYAARRAIARRGRKSRVPPCGIGMTSVWRRANSDQRSATRRRGEEGL